MVHKKVKKAIKKKKRKQKEELRAFIKVSISDSNHEYIKCKVREISK